MTYKLILSDMDGTLLTDDKKVTLGTKEAIDTLHRANLNFTIATGRIYPAARMYADDLGITTPLICCNGAVIINPQTHEVLYGKPLEWEAAKEIVRICKAYGVYYHLYDKDTIYSETLEKVILYFRKVSEILPEGYKIHTQVIDDVEALFNQTTVYKIGIYYDNTEKASEMRRELEALPGINGFKATEVMYDCMAEGVDKGTALEALCHILKVDIKETIAFGDNENDLEMIKKAGLGVAMGNAEAFVKDIADHITETNEEEGVRVVIENLFKHI